MNTPITNYIKERIATLRKEQEQFSMNWGNYWRIDSIISELQAVLSKIEELERKEFEKIVQVNPKS